MQDSSLPPLVYIVNSTCIVGLELSLQLSWVTTIGASDSPIRKSADTIWNGLLIPKADPIFCNFVQICMFHYFFFIKTAFGYAFCNIADRHHSFWLISP